MKPYDTEIIKLMAKHSDLSAAYASAMKWDWLRRQKVEDIEELDVTQNCAYCFIYNSKPNTQHDDCPVISPTGGCNKHYRDAINAWRKQDQQAFTTAANDLYFLIRSIIDDLYKPKPEPKKEVFYHIGQRFCWAEGTYKLTQIGVCEVMMINTKGCSSLWSSRKKVKDPYKITEDEFRQICDSSIFTLIEEKK